MNDGTTMIRWYQTEQEIKNDPSLQLRVTSEDIESVFLYVKSIIKLK